MAGNMQDNFDENGNPIRCSFCGKEQGQVRRLVKGPTNIFICDECVAACSEILEESLASDFMDAASNGKLPGFNNVNRVEYAPVNVARLEEKFADGDVVDATTLVERGIIIGQSRQTYALARCKCLPGFLGKLDKHGAPINALLVTSVIGIVLTLIGSVDVIVVIANMGSAFMALCCFISWIKLAKDQPDMPRPYKCPRWLGYIGIPFCLIVAFCSLYSAVTAGTLFYIAVAFFVIAMLYYAAVCKKKNGTFLVEPEDQ